MFKNFSVDKFSSENLSIFLHIPKTGGTALSATLDHIYGSEYRRISSHTLADYFKKGGTAEEYKFMLGHYSLTDSFYKELSGAINHLTILRHPEDRALSQYFYLLGESDHPLHTLAKEQTLSDSIISGTTYELGMVNRQATILSGLPPTARRNLVLEHAKLNLDKTFTFFGMFDQYDDFMEVCAHNLGWENIPKIITNVSERPEELEVTKRVLDILSGQNDLDNQLYAYASDLYEKKFKQLVVAVPATCFSNTIIRDTGEEYVTLEGIPVEEGIELEEPKPGFFSKLRYYLFSYDLFSVFRRNKRSDDDDLM